MKQLLSLILLIIVISCGGNSPTPAAKNIVPVNSDDTHKCHIQKEMTLLEYQKTITKKWSTKCMKVTHGSGPESHFIKSYEINENGVYRHTYKGYKKEGCKSKNIYTILQFNAVYSVSDKYFDEILQKFIKGYSLEIKPYHSVTREFYTVPHIFSVVTDEFSQETWYFKTNHCSNGTFFARFKDEVYFPQI
jgi:hypothetical protein